MPSRTISFGKCFLCGETLAKNAVNRHLEKCIPLHGSSGPGKRETLFHLLVEGRDDPRYWLHLEIPASATLADLDTFLRAIWLECCGHLSAFEIGGRRYEVATEGADFSFYDSPPKSMKSARLQRTLAIGDIFTHEYDFGTTTELKLKVVGAREGFIENAKFKVNLLTRNYAFIYYCNRCGSPAEYLYVFEYPYVPYCDDHANEKEDGEEGLMPIVNSPRVGECGYTGPYDETLQFEESMPAKDS